MPGKLWGEADVKSLAMLWEELTSRISPVLLDPQTVIGISHILGIAFLQGKGLKTSSIAGAHQHWPTIAMLMQETHELVLDHPRLYGALVNAHFNRENLSEFLALLKVSMKEGSR